MTPPASEPEKRRSWAYGAAAALGAALFVGAGYSVAVLQLKWRDESPTLQETQISAATAERAPVSVARVPAPGPAAAAPTLAPEEPFADDELAVGEGTAEPATRHKSPTGARMHAARARGAASTPLEAAQRDGEGSAQPEASAPPEPASSLAIEPQRERPSPRLIITPLPDLPEPQAAPANSTAAEPSAAGPQPAAEPGTEPTAAAPQPDENLPDQPSREEVQQRLLAMRDKLVPCAGDQHGTSYANVTIHGNGRVAHSTIEGAFARSPAGSCMARALRTATFPRFSGPQLTVRYPYVF
mgnify:CR=1 FL=1